MATTLGIDLSIIGLANKSPFQINLLSCRSTRNLSATMRLSFRGAHLRANPKSRSRSAWLDSGFARQEASARNEGYVALWLEECLERKRLDSLVSGAPVR
jgi:hypothetical protein